MIPLRNGQKIWIHTFSEAPWWLTDTQKDAYHHSSSRKYKSKSQWDTTSYLSEWLKLTAQEAVGVRGGTEKKELPCSVIGIGENAH